MYTITYRCRHPKRQQFYPTGVEWFSWTSLQEGLDHRVGPLCDLIAHILAGSFGQLSS